MEHKIGTRFTIEVVKDEGRINCEECFFREFKDCSELACDACQRADLNDVHYRVIESNEPKA